MLYLLDQGMQARELEKLLYQQSGLLGISGVSSDMRKLRASDDPHAALAIDYFAYRIAQEIGRLATCLGGLDALVFTAGIGEKDAALRAQVLEHLTTFGMSLDDAANQRNAECISSITSSRTVWVVPTDEESVIARHAWHLYQGQHV